MSQIFQYKYLTDIDLEDPFFDSLRKDYDGFNAWYKRKESEKRKAFVLYGDQGLLAFIFLKSEINERCEDIQPPLEPCRRLKVGTLKIEAHQTKLGERVLKLIFDQAILYGFEEIYLTIFPKHTPLIKLLHSYGFEEHGKKNEELVLIKRLTSPSAGDIKLDYPRFNPERKAFLLSVMPTYHTRLFPDSILNNEQTYSKELIQDCSHTNSIQKVYISWNENVSTLKEGDLITIYRTSDEQGPAHYRSVVTSICTVSKVIKSNYWSSCEDFIKDVLPYSVFSEEELTSFYKKTNFYVIHMLYNCALKERVTRGSLIEEAGIDCTQRWSFIPLTDQQFKYILNKGNVSQGLIIY